MNDRSAASDGEAVLCLGAVIFVLMNSGMPMTLALLRGWPFWTPEADEELRRALRSVVSAGRVGARPDSSLLSRPECLLLLVRGLHCLAVDLDHLLGDVLWHVLIAVQHCRKRTPPAGDRP